MIQGPSGDDREALIQVCRGRRPPELAITGARIVKPEQGRVLEGWDVGVWGPWIAAMLPSGQSTLADGAAKVIDAGGAFLLPGFIDAHTHVDAITSLESLAPACLVNGTTTLVSETISVANARGMAGMEWYLGQAAKQPNQVLLLAPLISFLKCRGARGEPALSFEQMLALLAGSPVAGLGECFWRDLLQSAQARELVLRARGMGLTVDGHGVGAHGGDLAAYAAAGVKGDHEVLSTRDARERLSLGMYCLLRHGSKRQDLGKVLEGWPPGAPTGRLVLATDTMLPQDLAEVGYMNHLVRLVIESGIDPLQAVGMATCNSARYLGLEHLLGAVAPGRLANLLLVPELPRMEISNVVAKGRVVMEQGELLLPEAEPDPGFPRLEPMPPLRGGEWLERSGGGSNALRLMRMTAPTLTRQGRWRPPGRSLPAQLPPDQDLCYLAVISRHDPSQRFLGLLRGFGLKKGALANSINFDESAFCALGPDWESLLTALNRIMETGGGIALARGPQVAADLPLPILGVQTTRPFAATAAFLRGLNHQMSQWGCTWPDPLYSMRSLTFTGLPDIRATSRGYYDVKLAAYLPLVGD